MAGLVLNCSADLDVNALGAGVAIASVHHHGCEALETIDFSKVVFSNDFWDHNEHKAVCDGDELVRYFEGRLDDLFLLGGRQASALYVNFRRRGERSVLEKLRINRGVTEMAFLGTLLRWRGQDCVLYLSFNGHTWKFFPPPLRRDWSVSSPVAVLPKV